MPEPPERDAPLRVVMFGSGPRLTPDAEAFLCRLDAEPRVDLAGAFCQCESRSISAVMRDLWRRRGVLALPLFAAWAGGEVARALWSPRETLARRRALGRMAGRLHFVRDIHARNVIAQVREMGPDLGLVYGSPLLRPELFEVPRLGTLGIHHGALPKYRGNKTTFWAMYNGEATAGVTIQKIDAGLDTGAIVKEASVPIGDRPLRAVRRDLEAAGLALYLQAILEVARGTATFRPQPGPRGRLYRNPRPRDLLAFWLRRARRRWTTVIHHGLGAATRP